jgi:hypothetical protein
MSSMAANPWFLIVKLSRNTKSVMQSESGHGISLRQFAIAGLSVPIGV